MIPVYIPPFNTNRTPPIISNRSPIKNNRLMNSIHFSLDEKKEPQDEMTREIKMILIDSLVI